MCFIVKRLNVAHLQAQGHVKLSRLLLRIFCLILELHLRDKCLLKPKNIHLVLVNDDTNQSYLLTKQMHDLIRRRIFVQIGIPQRG